MKVLIDGHMLGQREGGNERYIEGLISGLIKIRNLQLKVAVNSNYFYLNKFRNKNIFLKLDRNNDWPRLFYELPKIASDTKAEIIHSTYVCPLVTGTNVVLTVHDLAYRRFPNLFTNRQKLIFRYLLPLSMRKAKAIIVPSEFTKSELVYFYPEFKFKTFVINESASEIFSIINRNEARERVKSKYDINSPFILTFNSLIAKKNIYRVIEGFRKVSEYFPNLRLVILGPDSNMSKKDKRLKGIHLIDWVNNNDLNLLYNAAEVVVYYSIYEGFGLPIFEALKCKTVVLASDIQVHRELIKKGVVFVHPDKTEEFVVKLKILLSRKKYRQEIANEGFDAVSKFSWERAAQETVNVYKYVISRK